MSSTGSRQVLETAVDRLQCVDGERDAGLLSLALFDMGPGFEQAGAIVGVEPDHQ